GADRGRFNLEFALHAHPRTSRRSLSSGRPSAPGALIAKIWRRTVRGVSVDSPQAPMDSQIVGGEAAKRFEWRKRLSELRVPNSLVALASEGREIQAAFRGPQREIPHVLRFSSRKTAGAKISQRSRRELLWRRKRHEAAERDAEASDEASADVEGGGQRELLLRDCDDRHFEQRSGTKRLQARQGSNHRAHDRIPSGQRVKRTQVQIRRDKPLHYRPYLYARRRRRRPGVEQPGCGKLPNLENRNFSIDLDRRLQDRKRRPNVRKKARGGFERKTKIERA